MADAAAREEADAAAREEAVRRNVARCRERGIVLPTFAEMQRPLERVPADVQERVRGVRDMDALDPLNLFRITWHNDAPSGAFRSAPNYLVIPPALSGVPSPIVVLLGTHFPTGAHKVGATYWPLVSRLVSGRFDAVRHHALFPSTGNYCRGGAFDARLLGCPAIAVLPEGMSRERFHYLERVGAEVHATAGSESNVKEVFDRTRELARRDDVVVLDQFACFDNPLWHYGVTGHALEAAFRHYAAAVPADRPGCLPHDCSDVHGPRLAGCFFTQGSGGCLTGAARWLRQHAGEHLKVGAGEALQCPTLLGNGFGAHRIEGIGDKHVPWILDPRNMDVVAAIDDDDCMRLMRLFNEPAGHQALRDGGVDPSLVAQLHHVGISGIANIIGCAKMARLYEYGPDDVLVTVATDGVGMYHSRLEELRAEHGEYSATRAAVDWECALRRVRVDHMEELTHASRRRIHNLKYFTWVEQQGRCVEELERQWYDHHRYWHERFSQETLDRADDAIRAFNARVAQKQ